MNRELNSQEIREILKLLKKVLFYSPSIQWDFPEEYNRINEILDGNG